MNTTMTKQDVVDCARRIAERYLRDRCWEVKQGRTDQPISEWSYGEADTFAQAYRERLRQLIAEAQEHGVCACAACWVAGRPMCRRDWLLSRVEGTDSPTYPFRVTGVMLSSLPSERTAYGPGTFVWRVPEVSDPRYDTTNAVIDERALAWLEKRGARTTIEP
jgi:hypothetical protein